MSKPVISSALTAVLCFFLGSAVAAQTPPAKPAAGPATKTLAQWNDIGAKLIAMAEDFPEDKFDYRPNDQVRTFAQQLLHASASMYFATNPAWGKPVKDIDENPSREVYKTRARVVAYVKKCVEDGAAAIRHEGDEGVVAHIGNWIGIIEHSGEHYGQLVVYYRNNGIVPPDSRPKKK